MAIRTSTAQPTPDPLRRFSVEEYHRLIDAGILTEENRVELLEGLLVWRPVKNPLCVSTLHMAQESLFGRLPREWRVRNQSVVSFQDSEPQPDLAIIRDRGLYYDLHHPGPQDTALLVQIYETSHAYERELRLRVYARAAIPSYWRMIIPEKAVEAYTDPTDAVDIPTYRDRRVYRFGEELSLNVAGQMIASIPVDELFHE